MEEIAFSWHLGRAEGGGVSPGSGRRVGRVWMKLKEEPAGALGHWPTLRAAPALLQPFLCGVERKVSRGTCGKVTGTGEGCVVQWLERGVWGSGGA